MKSLVLSKTPKACQVRNFAFPHFFHQEWEGIGVCGVEIRSMKQIRHSLYFVPRGTYQLLVFFFSYGSSSLFGTVLTIKSTAETKRTGLKRRTYLPTNPALNATKNSPSFGRLHFFVRPTI